MSIDVETARRVAKLARIQVDDGDLPALAGELSNILGFMEQLSEVDVTGVEPMTSVTPMHLPWREDVVTAGREPGHTTVWAFTHTRRAEPFTQARPAPSYP